MNRRNFVRNLCVGLSGVCIPVQASTLFKSSNKIGQAPTLDFTEINRGLQLSLGESERTIIDLLERYSIETRIYGGYIIAKNYGNPVSHINLLINTPDFKKIKSALSSLSVNPVLQPFAQADSIRFMYRDQVFDVQNQRLEIIKQHWLSIQNTGEEGLFGHNMLVYFPAKKQLVDPIHVLEADRPVLVLANRPKSKSVALRTVLIGYLECNLLGLYEGNDFSDFSNIVLESNLTGNESREVAIELLNFMPDVVEKLGADKALKIVSSKICKSVLTETFGTDVEKLMSSYPVASKIFSQAYSPAEIFMALIIGNRTKSVAGNARYSAFGLTQMIAPMTQSSRSPRRLDLLARAVVLSNDSGFATYI